MNRKFILSLVLIFLLVVTGSFIEARALSEVYSEDYSFRSGQVYRVTYKEDGKIVKQENYMWTTQYPFKNPQAVDYNSFSRVYDNVGFVAKIIRRTNPIQYGEADILAGEVVYSLALLPRLEASETITFDKEDSDYLVYSNLNEYDRYGNLKKINNLGFTNTQKPDWNAQPPVVWGESLEKNYYTYKVRNPECNIYFDGDYCDSNLDCDGELVCENHNCVSACMPLNLISSETNMQSLNKPTFEDNYEEDNNFVENSFMYEDKPIENYFCSETGYDFDVRSSYAYQGLGGVSTEVQVKDSFGRIISNSKTIYETWPELFENCDIADSSVEDWNCYSPYEINAPEICKDNPVKRCVRISPKTITNYGSVSDGYFNLGYLEDGTILKENALSSSINSFYDNCGNVKKMSFSSYYNHPFEEPYGPNYDEDLELLKEYKKNVDISYQGLMVNPSSISTYSDDDLNLNLNSEYYDSNNKQELISVSTNERGVETFYDYDELGRVTKVVIWPDTLYSPTIEYIYEDFNGIRIKEKRKVDEINFIESYHFYDGFGRWIQTQTKEDANFMFVTSTSYDSLGRLSKEYRSIRVNLMDYSFGIYVSPDIFYFDEDGVVFSTYLEYNYDSFGRIITILDSADNSITTNSYEFNSDGVKENYVEDVLGNIRTFYSDVRGNLLKSEMPLA